MIACSRRPGKCGGTASAMNTSRVPWSRSGQRSSQMGASKTCWTPLHQGWLRRPFRHVHQSLDPQQSIAGVFGERLQQQGQCNGGNGRVESQDEAADAVGMLRRRRMACRIRLGHGGSGRKQPVGRHRAECRDSAWRVGVQRRHRVVKLRPGRGDVGLGEQDAAGQRHLAACLHMGRQRRGAVHRVHQRQHPGNGVVPGEPGVGHQRMQDRRRVGEAGGLDHHPVERDRIGRSARVQVEQRRHQVALDGAAQAAGRQQQHLAATLDQGMVQTDRAELVHDDRGAGIAGIAQHALDQGRLAAAEEAGDDQHRRPGTDRGGHSRDG